MKSRWTPFVFKNGKTTKNRVVVPPMASGTADTNGFVTQKTRDHYGNLCESGAGIVFVEYSFVDLSGRGAFNHLGVDRDDKIDGISSLAKIIHSKEILAGLQIVHNGGKTKSQYCGELIGPSAVRVPTKNMDLEIPRALSQEEIGEMKAWYVDAAGRVAKAGFDLVELHCAHGYGLNQWLSPITNHRTDDHGGGLENRARMLLDIARSIKEKYPSLLLSVRLPLKDHYEMGLTSGEMKWVVNALIEVGLDLIDVSSGIGGWDRPRDSIGEGYLVEDASAFKQHFYDEIVRKVPTIGVGGIESCKFIDHLISEDIVDFAAVGRAILKDPAMWCRDIMNEKVQQ